MTIIANTPLELIQEVAKGTDELTYCHSDHYGIVAHLKDGLITNKDDIDEELNWLVHSCVDMGVEVANYTHNVPPGVFQDELGGIKGMSQALWRNWLARTYIEP